MAAIETRKTRDGKVTYRVKIRLRGHPPQTASFDSKTHAKQWAQATEAAIREGRYFKTIEAKKHTLAELIDRYIATVLPTKPKSEDKQKIQLEWWKARIGCFVLSDVTPPLIAEYRDKLASSKSKRGKAFSPSTVARYMAALSHAFTVAMKEWHWVEDNPFRKVTKPREPKGRARFLSDEERLRLLQACKAAKSRYLYPIVVLALSTGMRFNEIMTLRWKDIDFEQGKVVLHETKNKDVRVVALVGVAHKELKELSKVRRIDTDLVFPNSMLGNMARPFEIRKHWDAALAAAKIDDFRFHDLRHSAASYLAMNGASLSEIAEVLGHRTLQMVKRYSHFSQAHTKKVVESMNAKIFGTNA